MANLSRLLRKPRRPMRPDPSHHDFAVIIHAMWTQGLSACPTRPTRRTGDNNMNGIAA